MVGVESRFWVAVTPRGRPEKALAPTPALLPGKSHGRRSLRSMESLGVGHDWATSLSLFTCMQWRRKWQPIPVFLPGESQGRGAWWAAVYGVAQSQTRLKWLGSGSSTWTADTQRLRVMTPASSAGGAACWLRGVGVAEWLRPACSLNLPLGFLRNLSHSDLDGLGPQDKGCFWTSNYWGLFSSLERNIDSQV